MAEADYLPDQDNDSQGWASRREDGVQPGRATRKVYRSYQKEAYQQDLAQEVRKQMKEGQEVNPRQKILAKKQADLPEDPFKMMKVGISGQLRRAGQQALTDQDETGTNLFLDNLDKEKVEREAKMKQYKRDLANQIQERASNPTPRNQSGAQKINNTSPPGARVGSAKKIQRPKAPAPRFLNPEESVSANAYFPNMQEQGDEGYGSNYDGYNGSRNNLGGEQPWNSQRSDAYSKQKGTGRLVSGVSTPGNEFFERNFGRPLELKKKIAEDKKKELVDELQKQIDDAKDKKRREKLQQQMEDMKAEERYLKEIERMREFSASRKKVAEAVNDQDVEPRPPSFRPQSNAYLEMVDTKRVSQRAPFVDPMLQNDFSRSQAELEPESTRPISKTDQAKASRRVSRDLALLAKNDLQGLPKPEVSFGGTQMSGRSHTPASFGDGGVKSQEYQSRVNLAAQDKLDEKKRELRMNTNLLYRQVIDLRGEKDYSGAMRDNAVMAYQEVQRKLNEANKALANDIQKVLYGSDIFTEDKLKSQNAPKEWYLQGKLSDWTKKDTGIEAIENPDPKLDEYRRAGLLMAQDSVYFSDKQQAQRQVARRSKIGEDGRIEADTDMVPIIEKEPDRNALEYLGNMSEPEFADMVAKEARGERLTSKYSRETHQERMADLRKKNLDFDSLLDQMVRECRNIYEDDIGVYPSKAGRGVDPLDRIIDNLYNDNLKLKYGSQTRQRTDLVNGMTPEELEDDTPRGNRENLETVIEKLNGPEAQSKPEGASQDFEEGTSSFKFVPRKKAEPEVGTKEQLSELRLKLDELRQQVDSQAGQGPSRGPTGGPPTSLEQRLPEKQAEETRPKSKEQLPEEGDGQAEEKAEGDDEAAQGEEEGNGEQQEQGEEEQAADDAEEQQGQDEEADGSGSMAEQDPPESLQEDGDSNPQQDGGSSGSKGGKGAAPDSDSRQNPSLSLDPKSPSERKGVLASPSIDPATGGLRRADSKKKVTFTGVKE